MKNFLNNILIRALQRIPYVQKLESYIKKLEADLKSALVGDINIVSMNMDNGKLNVAFKTKVTEALAEFGNSILEEADAKNYVEISFGFAPDRLVGSILIRKHDGESPHQLQLQAEADRDKAIAAMNKAIAEKEQLETEMLRIEYEDTDVRRGKKQS
jgi:hypothetical protein